MPNESRSLADRAALLLATGLGIGYIPWAPGTFGSLWGLAFVWGLMHLPVIASLVLALFAILLGVPLCGRAAKLLGKVDPGYVVFDEIAAFPIVFASVPAGWVRFDWQTALAGFLLFRLFDITKPWPARRLEHLPGGWGVMADDLAAGVYAGGALALVAWMFQLTV